ncbi:hypothetical protein [Novosphingobium sp.]|uniref:hypothetical protein n=1 Tax=Novosphingobium sp. TaxID=1874826 RepID=UPI002B4751A1|nr:hypothetical protein [Novosphingobium sp.]HJQ17090.1 hypothetical protein [Allosphingosinicella sp.]HKR91242.1 hypothetical protein [Novosphingobium sp.]
MKKLILALVGTAGAIVPLSGTAQAAPWQSVNQHEARLEMQIWQGVRSGALTRAEAVRLQNRLNALERLEVNFRRGGLTMAERRVLDQRFDALARSIRLQLADRQFRGNHRFGRY